VRTRILTPLLIAALVAGCGADEETEPSIPADTAAALEERLDEVQARFDFGDGACADITNDSQPAVESILASLPASVDRDVRSALEESFDRLFQLTAEQCDETKGEETEPETDTETETTETTTETETTDTTTETETTDTTETEPPTTETEPTVPTVPPEGDDDGGGGVGPEEGL
jgi:hypothetical protein